MELEENRLIAWGARNRLLTIIHRIHFEPLGPDRCRLRNHEFIEGVFAKVAGRFMANRINQFDRQMAADLAARFR